MRDLDPNILRALTNCPGKYSTKTLAEHLYVRRATLAKRLETLAAQSIVEWRRGARGTYGAKLWFKVGEPPPRPPNITLPELMTPEGNAILDYWNAKGYEYAPLAPFDASAWPWVARPPVADTRPPRKCIKCKQHKPAEEYGKDRTACRPCEVAESRDRRKRAKRQALDMAKARHVLGGKHATNTVTTLDAATICSLIRRTHQFTWTPGGPRLKKEPDPLACFARAVRLPPPKLPPGPTLQPGERGKVCIQCDRELPLTSEYFYVNTRARDGFRPDCKHCYHVRKADNVTRKALAIVLQTEADKQALALEGTGASLALTGLDALALADGSGTVTIGPDGKPTLRLA